VRTKKKVGFGAALTLALTLLVPAQAAQATSGVDCGNRTDFLKVTWNYGNDGSSCYAGYGTAFEVNGWASKISSGNNEIFWEADNQWHWMPRWSVLTFPTVGTIRLTGLRIL